MSLTVTSDDISGMEFDDYKEVSPGVYFSPEIGDYSVEVNGNTVCTFFGPFGEEAAKLFVDAVKNNNKKGIPYAGEATH